MALSYFLILISWSVVNAGPTGRAVGAMSDICSRSPGTSLCRWYSGGSSVANDPKIEPRVESSRLKEKEDASVPNDADHPRPPSIPLPQSANEDQKAYCDRYKPSFGYFCDKPSDPQVSEFCGSYGKTCRGWKTPVKTESPSVPPPERPAPREAGGRETPGAGAGTVAQDVPKQTFAPAPAGNVASACKEYKSVADAYCIGGEEGFTKYSCDQYRHYCAGYKESGSPAATLPPGTADYCGNFARDYSKLCSGERPTPVTATQFCRGYNAICSAYVAQQAGGKGGGKPSYPNFGDASNPFSPQNPNKENNFGGNANPLVNPQGPPSPVIGPKTETISNPTASSSSSSSAAAAAVPAPSAPSLPSSSGSAPVWPGLPGAPLPPPASEPAVPASPFGSSGGGAPNIPFANGGGGQPMGVGSGASAPFFGSSSGTGFGPNGIGTGSNTQAGPIGVSSGSGLGFGPNGIGSGSNTQAGPIGVSSGSGLGFGPNGIGSGSNTQAGPIGVSSGSGVGLGGTGNIPGLGQLGNGAGGGPLGSIPFLGKRK